jgi:hypothetical protein
MCVFSLCTLLIFTQNNCDLSDDCLNIWNNAYAGTPSNDFQFLGLLPNGDDMVVKPDKLRILKLVQTESFGGKYVAGSAVQVPNN